DTKSPSPAQQGLQDQLDPLAMRKAASSYSIAQLRMERQLKSLDVEPEQCLLPTSRSHGKRGCDK
ncbi:hypothetical protein CDV31_010467, partial [Fusarium ambrosium]